MEVLGLAADWGRILVTRPEGHAGSFRGSLRRGQVHGVFIVSQRPIAEAIEELLLIWHATDAQNG